MVIRYNGSGNGDDVGEAIVVDGSCNVYVTGFCTGNGTSKDCITIKYNASGVQQWASIYDGSGHAEDMAHSIVLDGSGNVYVTGKSNEGGASTDYSYITIKYNSSGTQQWAAIYNGEGDDWDEAYAIALDGNSNVYVTGKSKINANAIGDDLFNYATVKYNSSGVRQWVADYNGASNKNDEAYAIAIDGESNIYVTGRSYSNTTNFDMLTIKYNSSGTQQWSISYDNSNYHGVDEPYSITVDNSGYVYITDGSYGSGTKFDYLTIKYSQIGDNSVFYKPISN